MVDDEGFDDGLDDGGNDDGDSGTMVMNIADVKNLRRAANTASKNKAELIAAQREIAFHRAGVDVDSPIGKLFAKAYDGELDLAVIKEAAGEVNALRSGEIPPVTGETGTSEGVEGEQQSTGERNALAGNSPADQSPEIDPMQASIDSAKQNMKNGMGETDAMAEFVDDRLYAASKNDPRVIIRPGEQRPAGR